MDKAIEFVSRFLAELNIKQRISALIALSVIFIVFWGAVEVVTGNAYYNALEKKVGLIKEMEQIAKDGISSNGELYPLYKATINEIESRNIQPLLFPDKLFSNFEDVLRFLGGAGLWWLFGALALQGAMGSVNKVAYALILAILGAGIGWLVLFIPVIYSPYINLVGINVVQLLVILALSKLPKRQKT